MLMVVKMALKITLLTKYKELCLRYIHLPSSNFSFYLQNHHQPHVITDAHCEESTHRRALRQEKALLSAVVFTFLARAPSIY